MTALLDVQGLVKSFAGTTVLHGVGFTAQAGRALGLVGENGSGKSTTLNILGGVLRPDVGTMQLAGEPYAPHSPRAATVAGVAFVHQELNLFANLTIAENVHLDSFARLGPLPLIDRRRTRHATQALLQDVDLDMSADTKVGRLSQGERQLVELAKALSRDVRVIILDEPTTSLTRREIERLFGIVRRLKQRGICVIYVSHALEDVREICDDITVLRDGAVVGAGTVAELPVPRIVSLMVGRSIDTVFTDRHVEPGPVLLRVSGLSQRGVAHDVSLQVRAGEVVGISGLMGSGRSELARMVFGLDRYAAGAVEMSGRPVAGGSPAAAMAAGMAMLTEDRRADGLLMTATIADNVVLAALRAQSGRLGLVASRRAVAAARDIGRAVRLTTENLTHAEARHLSGGNQQKVVLGKWLLRQPRLFILDEPTRGIDIGAKHEIYRLVNALVEAGSGVLLISSEIEELVGLSDRILVLHRGEVVGSFQRDAFDREAIMTMAATGRPQVAA